MSKEEIITNNKPEEFDIKNIKTFEEMKEELGDKYEKYMYDCNIEFLKSVYEKDLQLYDLQSQLDIANKKLDEIKEYLKKERNNYYDQGIKLAETNLENLLVSASLCTCDNALSIIGGE